MTGIATEDIPQRMLPRGHLRLGDRRVVEPKAVWKLSSGAPVIPRVVYSSVAEFLSRFGFTNVRHFAAETCKYWTLKREARRGASLVRRLQVHADSNSFTSIEVVRKNYASMGRVQGTKKLEQRKDFAGALQNDLIRLMDVVKEVRKREDGRAKESEMMKAYVDAMYFPELPLMRDILNRALK
jgi:NuA3 HAT complex component NTO1